MPLKNGSGTISILLQLIVEWTWCCAVLCCAVLWYDMMWYDVMLWCDVMWCDVMWCDVMWCDVMWCDVMWCDVMWCDVMWCDVMWYDMIWDVNTSIPIPNPPIPIPPSPSQIKSKPTKPTKPTQPKQKQNKNKTKTKQKQNKNKKKTKKTKSKSKHIQIIHSLIHSFHSNKHTYIHHEMMNRVPKAERFTWDLESACEGVAFNDSATVATVLASGDSWHAFKSAPRFGCLVAWLLGCLVAWLLGCLVAWLLEWSSLALPQPHQWPPPLASFSSGVHYFEIEILNDARTSNTVIFLNIILLFSNVLVFMVVVFTALMALWWTTVENSVWLCSHKFCLHPKAIHLYWLFSRYYLP